MSVWLSRWLVTTLTLGHLTLLVVTRRDESCLQRASVTGKVTSDPLSHYCDVCWEKNKRHQNDDVTVAGVKSWKMWHRRPGALSISVLVSFCEERGENENAVVSDKMSYSWNVEKRKRTVYISEKVEKLLFCLSVKSAAEFTSRRVCVPFCRGRIYLRKW